MVARPPPHHLAFPSPSLSPKTLSATPCSFIGSSFPRTDGPIPARTIYALVTLLRYPPRREQSIQQRMTSLMAFAGRSFGTSRSTKDLEGGKATSAAPDRTPG